jgi:hypothetical protein
MTDDERAVRACALDYIEGWYSGDAERMERSLHPDLAKRTVEREDGTSIAVLRDTSASQMIEWTRARRGVGLPPSEWDIRVEVLGLERQAASVRIVSVRVVDHVHLAKLSEGWRIVNVLWLQRER